MPRYDIRELAAIFAGGALGALARAGLRGSMARDRHGAARAGGCVRVLVWAGVALLGGVGALLRFGLDGFVAERASGSEFPWGTFAVNISGSFALGVVAGASLHGDALR